MISKHPRRFVSTYVFPPLHTYLRRAVHIFALTFALSMRYPHIRPDVRTLAVVCAPSPLGIRTFAALTPLFRSFTRGTRIFACGVHFHCGLCTSAVVVRAYVLMFGPSPRHVHFYPLALALSHAALSHLPAAPAPSPRCQHLRCGARVSARSTRIFTCGGRTKRILD